MKFFQRFCFPLLCCALLLGVFSVTAKAAETKPYHIYITSSVATWYGTQNFSPITIIPHNGETLTKTSETSAHLYKNNPAMMFATAYYIANDDGSAIVHTGGEVTVSLESMYDSFTVLHPTNNTWKIVDNKPDRADVTIYYTDGTTQAVNGQVVLKPNGHFDLKAVFTPSKDVRQILFNVLTHEDWEDYAQYMQVNGNELRCTLIRELGEVAGDEYYTLVVQQDSKEVGLLNSIIDKVSSGFTDLKNGITNVFNSIVDLPSKIWGFIESGLKSLFVPSEEYLVSYKDKWTALLSDRLGAVWQVTEITFGAWGDIDSSDKTNTITIPATTLDLPDNSSFTFGGIDVEIVPEPFIFLADTVKLITSILATFLFINGIRKRYDEVMGVEQ